MISISQYSDFRLFIQDRIKELQRWQPSTTHRSLGKKGGFDPGLISKVIYGQRNISAKMIQAFALALELNAKETTEFEILTNYTQAQKQSAKKKFLVELIRFRSTNIPTLAPEKHQYFENWINPLVRELILVFPEEKDSGALARKILPEVNRKEISKSLKLLQKLNLIEDQQGTWSPKENLITSGYDFSSTYINELILQQIELAKNAFDQSEKEERNLSGITFSCSEKTYHNLIEKVRLFRREIMQILQSDPECERVYQMNMQLFPLSKSAKKQSHL